MRSYVKALPKPRCACGKPATHVAVNAFNAESLPMCKPHATAYDRTTR